MNSLALNLYRITFRGGLSVTTTATHALKAQAKVASKHPGMIARCNFIGKVRTMTDKPVTPAAEWIGLYDEDGTPWAAYVTGHRDVTALCIDAEPAIIAAFYGDAGTVRELLDESGGAVLAHFWLRAAGERDDMTVYLPAESSQSGAFPVTGVRFA